MLQLLIIQLLVKSLDGLAVLLLLTFELLFQIFNFLLGLAKLLILIVQLPLNTFLGCPLRAGLDVLVCCLFLGLPLGLFGSIELDLKLVNLS